MPKRLKTSNDGSHTGEGQSQVAGQHPISDKPSFNLPADLYEYELETLDFLGISRTEFWHQLARWNWICWQKSPYVILESVQYVFVSADCSVFYWIQEKLRANVRQDRVAFSIRMKEAMRMAYHKQYLSLPNKSQSEDDFLRSQWMMSFFGVYSEGLELAAEPDLDGVSQKAPELILSTEFSEGELFEREMLIGLKDYVQFHGETKEADDRVGINILVPMRCLDLTVVIDSRIYGSGARPKSLNIQLRNPEEVSFASDSVSWLRDFTPFHEEAITRESTSKSQELHEKLLKRIGELSVHEKFVREPARCSPSFPEVSNILGHHVSWKWPHPPVELCVSWRKPKRPAP